MTDYTVTDCVTEEALAELYLRMKYTKWRGTEHSLADVVWYGQQHSLRWWLDWMASDKTYCVLFLRTSDNGTELCGAGWVYDPETFSNGETKATVGFAVLPDVSVFDALKLGRKAFALAKDKLNVDYYFGVTPASNRAAVAYARRLGMNVTGPVENYVEFLGYTDDAYISTLEVKSLILN